MPSKMLRPNVGIYVASSDAFADWKNPTFAELTSSTKVFNISAAVTDDYTLNQTDSQSDNSLSLVDNADVTTPTYFNYEASLDGFRDQSLTATSVYNKFRDLFNTVDTEYYLIKRVGKLHSDTLVGGDLISIFGVKTDYPVDIFGDGEMIRFGARFLTTGKVKLNYTVPTGTATAFGTTAATTGTKTTSNGKIKVSWTPVANVTTESTFLTGTALTILADTTKSYDLTEAIAWDSFELGNQDSNKIEDRSILDEGQVQTRGFAQMSGMLNFFRSPKSTSTATVVSGAAAASTFVVSTDITSKVEVGMSVKVMSADGLTTRFKDLTVTAVSYSSPNTTVTLSGANATLLVAGDIATFFNAQTLAWDTFYLSTGSTRPTGYLTVRVNKTATSVYAASDVVSIYKFTADAVKENTEGEDSIKFMVNFAPQGKLGKNVVLA
jgi:hypothetical protein